jgi:hypothetical protein
MTESQTNEVLGNVSEASWTIRPRWARRKPKNSKPGLSAPLDGEEAADPPNEGLGYPFSPFAIAILNLVSSVMLELDVATRRSVSKLREAARCVNRLGVQDLALNQAVEQAFREENEAIRGSQGLMEKCVILVNDIVIPLREPAGKQLNRPRAARIQVPFPTSLFRRKRIGFSCQRNIWP